MDRVSERKLFSERVNFSMCCEQGLVGEHMKLHSASHGKMTNKIGAQLCKGQFDTVCVKKMVGRRNFCDLSPLFEMQEFNALPSRSSLQCSH